LGPSDQFRLTSGYASEMASGPLYDSLIEAAATACSEAVDLRRFHRRSTKRQNDLRTKQLTGALEKLSAAAAPIRSEIGRLPYTRISEKTEARLRQASVQLQAERRKLRKML
jgi:hypothetical protein